MYETYYKNNKTSEQINLKINGYSLGGPLSQIFIHLILDTYHENTFNIENYNIETWFSGSKEDYENFTKLTQVYNIYNKKSVLYFYNIIFQKYFKVNNFLEINEINDIENSILRLFPEGIIKYINNNHVLSKIVN